jgi:hypothetical protein
MTRAKVELLGASRIPGVALVGATAARGLSSARCARLRAPGRVDRDQSNDRDVSDRGLRFVN